MKCQDNWPNQRVQAHGVARGPESRRAARRRIFSPAPRMPKAIAKFGLSASAFSTSSADLSRIALPEFHERSFRYVRTEDRGPSRAPACCNGPRAPGCRSFRCTLVLEVAIIGVREARVRLGIVWIELDRLR